MAGNLIDLRRRIQSVKNTQKITKAMKTVSAVKLKRFVTMLNRQRSFIDRLLNLLSQVISQTGESQNPFLQSHETGSSVLVVVSADKGLCGAFNTNVFKKIIAVNQV